MCGTRCGEACGACAATEACRDGQCVCAPSCDEARCAQPDGCGATCPPCGAASNCEGCALTLDVLDTSARGFVLALAHQPQGDGPPPTMADLRLQVAGARLTQVGLTPELQAAEKGVHRDPETGRAFHELPDGTVQLLLLSTANTNPLPTGPWLHLRFTFERGATQPAIVHLVERDETFAPPPADATLWSGGYGAPVVVWP